MSRKAAGLTNKLKQTLWFLFITHVLSILMMSLFKMLHINMSYFIWFNIILALMFFSETYNEIG